MMKRSEDTLLPPYHNFWGFDYEVVVVGINSRECFDFSSLLSISCVTSRFLLFILNGSHISLKVR